MKSKFSSLKTGSDNNGNTLIVVFLLIAAVTVTIQWAKPTFEYSPTKHNNPQETFESDLIATADLSESSKSVSHGDQVLKKSAVERANEFKQSLNNLKETEGKLGGDDLRKAVYESLIRDAIAMRMIENTIKDSQFARVMFGEDQARARVYAIEVLELAAKQGNLAPLESAIKGTMSELALLRAPRSQAQSSHGRESDLSDLVAGWIRSIGKEKIEQNPSLLFSQLAYQGSFRAEFATAIRYAFGNGKIHDQTFVYNFLPYLKGDKQ